MSSKQNFVKKNTHSYQVWNMHTGKIETVVSKPNIQKNQLDTKDYRTMNAIQANHTNLELAQSREVKTTFVVKSRFGLGDKANNQELKDFILLHGWKRVEGWKQIADGVRNIYIAMSRKEEDPKATSGYKTKYLLVNIDEKRNVSFDQYDSLADLKADVRLLNALLSEATADEITTAMQALDIRNRKTPLVYDSAMPKPEAKPMIKREFVIVSDSGAYLTNKGEFNADADLAKRFTKNAAYNTAFEIKAKKHINCRHLHESRIDSNFAPSDTIGEAQPSHYRDNGYLEQSDQPLNTESVIALQPARVVAHMTGGEPDIITEDVTDVEYTVA